MKREQIIGNQYFVVSKIGVGGFATVYKAWDNMLQKFVAIKKIHEEYSIDAKYVDMFRREAVNTAKLEHENIVRVINFIKDSEGNFFIIMDYVEGLDLEYLIVKCHEGLIKIPVDNAVYIIAEVIKALDYAHTVNDSVTKKPLNIVHRDVSPGNVMLYFDGRIKLTDFGIALAGKQRIETIDKNKLKGKIPYMSPEQARGEITIDARSDIFSGGLILYEMLTGEKAFAGSTDVDIWRNVKDVNISFRKLQDANVPRQVIEILYKTLQKSLDKRYQNASEMFVDIKKYLSKVGNTEELRKNYNQFMAGVLAEEIKVVEKEMERDSKRDFRVVADETKEEVFARDIVESLISEEYGKEPEKERKSTDKTVHDFVLDTARRYRKIFISVSILIFGIFVAYTGIDTYMQWTVWGTRIHTAIWPPALKIDSVPSHARIELMSGGMDIIKAEGYNTRTPCNIVKIQPGFYVLKLSRKNFGEVIKSVTIHSGQKAGQNILIPGARQINDVYVIPFEMEIEVNSYPGGAELIVDDTKIGKTPFKGTVEFGVHNFKLIKNGFEVLGCEKEKRGELKGICIIDTLKPLEEQSQIDRRYWNIEETKMEKGIKKLVLHGRLWKKVRVTSKPSGASVYVDNFKISMGNTPINDLALSAGEHIINISKKGCQPWSKMVTVNSEGPDPISAFLRKEITIHAYEKGSPKRDIGATVSIKGTKFKGKTPFKVFLFSRNYTFVLEKKPMYKSVTLSRDISYFENKLNVPMEIGALGKTMYPYMHITVKDYKSGEKINSAMIWINDSYWRRTGKSGIASGYVQQPPGEFRIEVNVDGYNDFHTFVPADRGERKKIEISMGAPEDGTIIIDTSDGFYGALIYMNKVYIGETLQQIANVSRTGHIIEIISDDNKKISKKVQISKPNQVVILKLVQDDSGLYLKDIDPEVYWK